MKVAIVDTNYTKRKHWGLAASWLRWEIGRASNVTEVEPEVAEFLLCTISSQQGISRLRGELRSIHNKRARVILGGGGCYGPAVFDPHIDVACVGEGVRFIRTLFSDGYEMALDLPEAWIPGDTREVVPFGGFPWECPPLNHPDGTVRVFGARGCKYRCLFCQTGWEIDYRPNPDPVRLQSQIDHLNRLGCRVAVVTNDGAEEQARVRGQQEFVSMRFQNLRKLMPMTRRDTKTVRIGVEGISERLRVAVGKPVPNDDLLSTTFDLLRHGVGTTWFFIPGLPGEIDADYEELRYLIRQLHKLPKGAVMMNFHSFIPQAATPLGVLPLVDDYWERFDEFRRWFFDGPGFTRRVQIVAPNQYKSRLRRARESMAATEAELRRGWFEHDNPNWRIRYLMDADGLRRVARQYAERVEFNTMTNGTPELMG